MKALDNPEFYEQLSKPTFTSSSGAVDKAFGDTYISSVGHTRAVSERPWTPVLIEGTRGTTTGASDPRLIGAEMATTDAPTENTSMADFTRGEFNARLEAAEERTNARLAGIKADLDVGLARLEGEMRSVGADVKLVIGTFRSLNDDMKTATEDIVNLTSKIDQAEEKTRNGISEIKSAQLNMRIWHVGTAIALFVAVLAVLTFGKNMFDWGQLTAPNRPASEVRVNPDQGLSP